ncbi:unnamed protein product [Lactuca virosa]|uniref:Uncharacterized protein n=1 Tax=Lactuca virosa TaxID=75947 RepID=A0AAU9P8K4_9ASTR|nr:unnamed protein product [Lactuca virosa]
MKQSKNRPTGHRLTRPSLSQQQPKRGRELRFRGKIDNVFFFFCSCNGPVKEWKCEEEIEKGAVKRGN